MKLNALKIFGLPSDSSIFEIKQTYNELYELNFSRPHLLPLLNNAYKILTGEEPVIPRRRKLLKVIALTKDLKVTVLNVRLDCE